MLVDITGLRFDSRWRGRPSRTRAGGSVGAPTRRDPMRAAFGRLLIGAGEASPETVKLAALAMR